MEGSQLMLTSRQASRQSKGGEIYAHVGQGKSFFTLLEGLLQKLTEKYQREEPLRVVKTNPATQGSLRPSPK